MDVENFVTLEELFYNVEDPTGYQILQWLRFKKSGRSVDPHEIIVIQGLYEGWKMGTIKVEGDLAVLREWEEN